MRHPQPGLVQGVMLLLPATMAVMGILALAPVVPLMLEQFKDIPHHEYVVIGGVLTMPAIWVLLFSPAAGWLADKVGRRNLLLTAMLVYAPLGIAPAFLDNIYAIVATRVGVGICESIVITVSTTMISDYFHGRARERWLAGQTAVAGIAAVGIVFLGGQLGAAFGWRGPFYLYSYSAVLALAGVFVLWEPTAEDGGVDTGGLPGADDPTAFPWARTLGICGLTLLASISFYAMLTKNAEALGVLGVTDPALIGKYSMLATLGATVGTFAYWPASRLPIGWLLALDFVLLGVGFVVMGRAADTSVYVWGTFINQIGCGMILPTMLVWATNGLAFAVRGRGTGLWQATFAVGQFLSGMVVTVLSALFGGLLATFALMGIGALVCAAIAACTAILGRKPPVEAGGLVTKRT